MHPHAHPLSIKKVEKHLSHPPTNKKLDSDLTQPVRNDGFSSLDFLHTSHQVAYHLTPQKFSCTLFSEVLHSPNPVPSPVLSNFALVNTIFVTFFIGFPITSYPSNHMPCVIDILNHMPKLVHEICCHSFYR